MNKGNKHERYLLFCQVIQIIKKSIFSTLFQFYEDNSGRLEHMAHVIYTYDLSLTSSCLESEKDVSQGNSWTY